MEEVEVFPDKYWHCHVELAGNSKKKGRSAVFNDLTFDELSQQIITPWHSGIAFTVDGMIIKNIDDIQKIKITNTPQPKSYYADQHNNKMRSSGIANMATDRRLLPLSSGKDYTHELLFKEENPSDETWPREGATGLQRHHLFFLTSLSRIGSSHRPYNPYPIVYR